MENEVGINLIAGVDLTRADGTHYLDRGCSIIATAAVTSDETPDAITVRDTAIKTYSPSL